MQLIVSPARRLRTREMQHLSQSIPLRVFIVLDPRLNRTASSSLSTDPKTPCDIVVLYLDGHWQKKNESSGQRKSGAGLPSNSAMPGPATPGPAQLPAAVFRPGRHPDPPLARRPPEDGGLDRVAVPRRLHVRRWSVGRYLGPFAGFYTDSMSSAKSGSAHSSRCKSSSATRQPSRSRPHVDSYSKVSRWRRKSTRNSGEVGWACAPCRESRQSVESNPWALLRHC